MERLQARVGVETRHLALPDRGVLRAHELGPRRTIIGSTSRRISAKKRYAALCRAPASLPADFGALFFVSVTGISSPSIDARLVNRMKLPLNIKRIPIFGLGCVAGAAGIARAADYVRAYPKQVAAVLSVELCSLTLQQEDVSIANIISSGLFGDGAAAVLVPVRMRAPDGPEILATRSVFYPDSEHVMGWDISEKGFRIVLSREVPEVVETASGVGRGRVSRRAGPVALRHRRWVLHTGGPRVLEATQAALGSARRRAGGIVGVPAPNRQSVFGIRAAGAGRIHDETAAGARHLQPAGRHGPGLLFRTRIVEVVVFGDSRLNRCFVVGGGPAGLAAAIAARLKGFDVVVADAAQPPIDKACGEGLMPDSIDALGRLGIAADPEQSFVFRGIRFIGEGGSVAANFPRCPGIAMRRVRLHQLLIDRAESVRRAAAVGYSRHWDRRYPRPLDHRRRRNEFACEALGGARCGAFASRFATVSGGIIAWRLDRNSWRFTGRRCQMYVTPVGQDEACVALITRDPHLRVDAAMSCFPDLARRLRFAEPAGAERGAITVTRRLRSIYRGHTVLIGDASGSVDAITGEGMSLSFRQALVLADALVSGDLAAYQRAHRRMARRPAFMARLMLLLDEFPRARPHVLRAFAAEPVIFERLLAVHAGA